MKKQTKLRTIQVTETRNLSFPIGSIIATEYLFGKLGLWDVLSKHKKKGLPLERLTWSLVSHKLSENRSISQAGDWVNGPELLQIFSLEKFDVKALYRALETIGKNREEIISDVQDGLFSVYDFKRTDVILDWTSLVLHGKACPLGKYGFSKDHRPDKKQLTVGVAELSTPINIPIGLTVNRGNLVDQKHFPITYGQVKGKLKQASLLTFDKGAYSEENLSIVSNDGMKYLTSRKLNKSDDKRIASFRKNRDERIDAEDGIYCTEYEWGEKFNYFFFSEKLKDDQVEARKRNALRKFEEAKEIQHCIDNGKRIPTRYLFADNKLVDVEYSFQTRINELGGEEAARKFIEEASLNGREGFFALISTRHLTPKQALETYRKKDSVEKLINSLKNEIEIKPVRVWTENGVYGALFIGFLAQLVVSVLRFEEEELRHISTKFIKKSLENLTVTVEYRSDKRKREIFSNFEPINRAILKKWSGIT